MSFTCGAHGWRHAQSSCPVCKELVADTVMKNSLGYRYTPPSSISITAAARMQMLQDLMDTNVYDDGGNVIGQQEPILRLSKEETLKILNGIE